MLLFAFLVSEINQVSYQYVHKAYVQLTNATFGDEKKIEIFVTKEKEKIPLLSFSFLCLDG